MTRLGSRLSFFMALFLATPLLAQQPTNDERIRSLEQRLDELSKQVSDIRSELATLKGTPAPAAPAPAAAEDLTTIDVAPAAANTANAVAAAKVFNPDTSVIGNFLGHAGQRNDFEYGPDDLRAPMQLDEAEVAFEAFVDPYAKAKFFLSATPEGLEVEEGYAQFVTLPHGVTAKVGKMKAAFGKDNTWHSHQRPWADQPLVIHNFFGDEGLADSGVSVSKDFANPWNLFIEGTAEAFSGDVENVFNRTATNDLFYNAHLKAFKDISENSNLEVGTSYALGSRDGRGNKFGGVDVTYRWKPLERGLYRSTIARLEAIANDNPASRGTLKGFYSSLDVQFAQRWFAGVRIDEADRLAAAGSTAGHPGFAQLTDRGASATLSFWPSEFSQIRGQLRRTRYGNAKSITELLLQLQFSIGAHGAHTF